MSTTCQPDVKKNVTIDIKLLSGFIYFYKIWRKNRKQIEKLNKCKMLFSNVENIERTNKYGSLPNNV